MSRRRRSRGGGQGEAARSRREGRADLAALEVLDTEGVDRHRLDSELLAVLQDLDQRAVAGLVAGDRLLPRPLGPAAVAVHDEGHVLRDLQGRSVLAVSLCQLNPLSNRKEAGHVSRGATRKGGA